jgi:hypothetical protein
MPYNKSEKINNQRNEASFKEEERTPKAKKQGEVPPSLNGIDKEKV